MNIYIWRDDEQYGPYSEAQARIYLNEGYLDADDQARTEGGRWVLLEEILPAVVNVPAQENSVGAGAVTVADAVVVPAAVVTVAAVSATASNLPPDFFPGQQELVLNDPRPVVAAKPPPAKRPLKKARWVPAPDIRPETEASPTPVSVALADAPAISDAPPEVFIPGDPPPPLDDVSEIVPDYPRPELAPGPEFPPDDFAPEPDSSSADYVPEPDSPRAEPVSEFTPVDDPPDFPPAPARPAERSPYGLIIGFLVVVAILDATVAFFYFSHKPVPIAASTQSEIADTSSDSIVPLPAPPSADGKPASSSASTENTGPTLALDTPSTSANGAGTNLTFALSSSSNADGAAATPPPAADSNPAAPALPISKPTTSTPPLIAEAASIHTFSAPTNSLAPPPDWPAPIPAIPVDQLGTTGSAAAPAISAAKPKQPSGPAMVSAKTPAAAPSAAVSKPTPAIPVEATQSAPAKKGPGHTFDADAIMKACMVPEGLGTSFDTGRFNHEFVGHTFTFTGEVARLNEKEGLVVFRGGGGYPKNWDLQLLHGKFTFEPSHRYRVIFRLLDVKTPPFSGYSFRGKVLGKWHA